MQRISIAAGSGGGSVRTTVGIVAGFGPLVFGTVRNHAKFDVSNSNYALVQVWSESRDRFGGTGHLCSDA